ncbi:hypothetical protein [Nocardia sp. NBC_00511]|uniref:hypothetical protein n=1 Tax=Nocardia sp. NBC_00511 TaxID=2903591 RepID=UPI0030E3B08E
MLSFRTDFTRPEAGWPTEYILWLAAPPEDLATIGRDLSTWPETRICLSVVGRANLLLMTQTHHPTHLHPLLTRLATSHPEAAVVDQRLILRPIKSWGRLLDRSGQAAAVVPVNPWAATTTDE